MLIERKTYCLVVPVKLRLRQTCSERCTAVSTKEPKSTSLFTERHSLRKFLDWSKSNRQSHETAHIPSNTNQPFLLSRCYVFETLDGSVYMQLPFPVTRDEEEEEKLTMFEDVDADEDIHEIKVWIAGVRNHYN